MLEDRSYKHTLEELLIVGKDIFVSSRDAKIYKSYFLI